MARSTPGSLAGVVVFGLLVTSGLSGQTAAPTPAIRVTLLGTGSPIPRIERFGPSILVEAGGERMLFDVGRGATIRLWQIKVPLGAVTAVFFTHLHSDHVVGFPDLWLTGTLQNKLWGGRTGGLQVYGPAGTSAMTTHLTEAYEADIRIRQADEKIPAAASLIEAHDITEGEVYARNGVRVTAFDVDHGDLIKPALGYRIDYAGHSVVLSGDTRVSENLIHHAVGTDVLFHEVAAAQPGLVERSDAARRVIGHHTTPIEAAGVFSRVKPRLAVYTHIVLLAPDSTAVSPSIDDVMAATRARYAGPLEAGEDLMSVEVGQLVTIHWFGSEKKRTIP